MFEKAVFKDIQQDVVLLLACNDALPGIRRLEVKKGMKLTQELLDDARVVPDMTDWLGGKWTHLISNPKTISLLGSLFKNRQVCMLGDIAQVKLGQVTGKNEYFLLDRDMVSQYGIDSKWLKPMISKASEIYGSVLRASDRTLIEKKGGRCFGLVIPSTAIINTDKNLLEYLERGRREGYDQGHKCRTRWPWYSIPMQSPPDAFLTYMSGEKVRLVLNGADVNSTNTIHNVFLDSGLTQNKKRAVVAAFYSSLTALSSELMGRAYGGGVLKLELNDARRLLMVRPELLSNDITGVLAKLLNKVDSSIRKGRDPYELVNKLLLGEVLGLSKSEIAFLASEQKRMSTRRMMRLR